MKFTPLDQLLFKNPNESLSFYLPSWEKKIEIWNNLHEKILQQLKSENKTELLLQLDKHQSEILELWKSSQKSLAFFFSSKLQGYHDLTNPTEAFYVMGESFYLRPLLKDAFPYAEFILINVSLDEVKIYRGDFKHLEVIEFYDFDEFHKTSRTPHHFFSPYSFSSDILPASTVHALRVVSKKIQELLLYESLPVIVTGIEVMKFHFLKYVDPSLPLMTHFDEDFFQKDSQEVAQKCLKFQPAILDFYTRKLGERYRKRRAFHHIKLRTPTKESP